jgi:hypothetical protein
MFIQRLAEQTVRVALERQAAVALIGPRQVGKTTLARMLGTVRDALYLDLEDREDREARKPAPVPGVLRTGWSSSTRFTACQSCSRRCGASSTRGGATAKGPAAS